MSFRKGKVFVLLTIFALLAWGCDSGADAVFSPTYLTDVSITGSAELTATGEESYTAQPASAGLFFDASKVSYEWSVQPETYAELVANTGATVALKAKNTTTADQTVTLTVKASYAGVEKTATKEVTIKAAPENPPVGEDAVTAVEINASATQIGSAGTTTLTAKPTKTGNPTIAYTWAISEGSDYATLSATSGESVTLTGKNTTATAQKVKVTVTAKYTDKNGTDQEVSVASPVEISVASQTQKAISSLVITGANTIACDAKTTLKATAETTGDPTLTYAWSIKENTAAASLSESTSDTVELTANNTSESSVTVTVIVTASDTTDSSINKTSEEFQITIAAKGVEVKDEVSKVEINASATQIGSAGTATLTAKPTISGNPTIAYTWAISEGSDYATLSATSGESVTLTGKNTTATAQKVKVTVTAKYTVDGEEKSVSAATPTEITVAAKTVASIAIKSAPAKLVYKLGETLDLTGLVITPTMNNGTTGTDVAYSDTTKDDFAASGFVSTAVAATKTVTVTYKNIATATATFDAKIIALAGLEITTPPTKTTGYKSTDTALDLAGMVVTATYTDDTPEGVGLYATDVTNKVTLSKPDFTSSGEQTITVTYKEGSGDLQKTATDSFKITVLHDYAQKMTLDFTGSSPAGKAWNGVPIRGSGNVAALVTRAEGSYAGYLGRKFWLVGGVFAEYCNSAAGLGYTNSEKDTAHTSTDFVKAIESEAITGPFKLTVKTSAKEREFRIYVSSDKTALWTSNPVVAENLNANSGTHTFEYTETTPMYIGIGTLPASDKTVYTSISSIILETDTEIPADKFPVTSIAFTNDAINEGKLSLSKDVFAEAGTSGYQLTAEITPAYATDNTYTFAYTTEATSSHISVSEAGVITLTDADNMNVNETGTITVTANGGTNVKASIELTVVAQVDDATKIETTRKQLEEAFNGTSSTFEYGSVATAATNATTLINTLKLTYKNDVTITPNVDETTGKLTLTISISGSSAENATVEYAYTEALAQAAVKTAVSQIKKGSVEGFTWNTDAATTASKIREEIAKITLTDATATVSATDSETVVVAVTSTIIATVKDETIVVSSPNILAGAYNISTNAVEGYSVDGVSGGKWSKQTAGSGVSQTHDKITITASIDSNGANLKNKDSNVGYMTFTIGRTMNFVFTDPAEKGIEIFSANGSSLGKYGATGSETSVTLSAGTYIIYGATASSAKIKTVKFTEVTGAGVTGDLSDIPTAEKDITLTVSGNVVTVGNVSDTAQNVSYVWYVNNVKVSGESSATFTLPSSSVIGETYIVRATVTIDGVTYTKTVSVMYE